MVIAGLCLAGCEQRTQPTPIPDTNLLKNASFEGDSREPWFSFDDRNPKQWGAFSISDERAHTGERSALLELDSDDSDDAIRVLGVVQEIEGAACPEYLSGWYLVEGWRRGAQKQYVQAVVIASGGPTPAGVPNYQLAYTLAGVTTNPMPTLKNRKFVVTGPPEPVEGEWVFFEIEIARLFEVKWGRRPGEDASLRVFFEVRYDGRDPADDARARARVWFDDLYFGPESRAPGGG